MKDRRKGRTPARPTPPIGKKLLSRKKPLDAYEGVV
jgi:hypothetical protein